MVRQAKVASVRVASLAAGQLEQVMAGPIVFSRCVSSMHVVIYRSNFQTFLTQAK